MTGKVTLVGAGPGDPGLLTLRGLEALQSAEVVVYDRLVGEEILNLIPASAQRVDVGKHPGHHPVPQWSINEILLKEAQKGRNVVRLKGGDPYLFGRGAEELELLQKHGVPFEVVSGVTSALAVPAAAGIPVTHRDWASSVHIVTGHARSGKALDLNFSALTAAGGTCVFLMGMAALEGICTGLLAAGMDPDTPAAVVERGTLPGQRKVVSTLARLAAEARSAGLSNPAVIVVGPVAALSEALDWRSARPLTGQRVIVTRSAGRGEALCSSLRALGAEVLNCPTVSTVSTVDSAKLSKILNLSKCIQWIAFTSAAGVEAVFSALWEAGLDARSLGAVRFAAIGPATARALEAQRLRADFVPAVYDSEHLARGLAERLEGGTVLLLRSAIATPTLSRVLTEAGASWLELPVYDARLPEEPDPALTAWLERGESLVTFSSGSTVRGFVRALEPGADLSRVRGVSIGAQTAAMCAQNGIPTLVAAEATERGLIDLILNQFGERRAEP